MDIDLPTIEEMKERLDTWAARYYVAGASLGVMHGDDVRVVATGVINKNTGVEVTPGTLFQMGSITKLYTATLVMQLIDEGRLELDAPAVTYLPELRFADEAETRCVTLRHLLTHTSGVDGDFFDDFGRGDDAVAKYVDACAKLPFVFPVGSMWSYCNAGFVVLGRMIEIVTGGTWDAALRTRLLDPLGVKQTVTLPEEALLHNTAAGHLVAPSLEISLVPVWGMARCAAPAGATPCTTVADLLTFAKMHADSGLAADGKRLLSDASVRAMQQSQFDLPVVPGPGAAHWGLGWMLFDWDGRRVIGHDGGTIGQMASMRALPGERFAVALLTNTSPTGGLLADRVMRWLFGQRLGIEMPERPRPPESPPEIDVRPYVGVYERLGFHINIAERDGVLTATYTNTGPLADMQPELPPMSLIPQDASVFLQRDPYTGLFGAVVFDGFEDGRPRYFVAGRIARRVD